MLNSYRLTNYACKVGLIVQALVINIVPLLFVCMQETFDVSIVKLTSLVTYSFVIQFLIDLFSLKILEKLGCKIVVILSHMFSFSGLILLSFLPFVMVNSFLGIVISIVIASLGSGLIEVTVSPIVEAIPGQKSQREMNFLHAGYCVGVALTIILVTILLNTKIQWRWIPIIGAILPFANGILFCFVPVNNLKAESEEKKLSLKQLIKNKDFIVCFIMILCAGAIEQSVAQWASYFAQRGLLVSKNLGDLVGPLSFAILMAIARIATGFVSKKIGNEKLIFFCSIGAIISYIIVAISPAIIALIGVGLCGLFVGCMWPTCLNIAALNFKNGETKVFSIMSLGGDVGCTMGPTMVGVIAGSVLNENSYGLRLGIGISTIFSIIMLISSIYIYKNLVKEKQ